MSACQGVVVCRVAVEQIIDLRWRILRAGLPRQTACFEGDTEPTTHHLAALLDGQVVGCATILRRPWQKADAWQVRGMAVDEHLQRQGIGRVLLEAVERVVRAEQFSRQMWCNARTPATAFYLKNGWQLVGLEFVIPTAGPHFKMIRSLD